ncbi:geranylgeranylglyceryl/heptaprenylglyceryl phosphate synthase [bacterium]|nr:MAG: geranylgeranylglyceryl/heptaprenylglyceryl phosphate synthase [bacterium]
MSKKIDVIERLSEPFRYERGRPQFWLLIDPDRAENIDSLVGSAQECGVDAFLVGSTILVRKPIDSVIKQIKSISDLPVIIFPGGHNQVSRSADALLFLTFLSSRNPRWLIEEQVLSAHKIRDINIPVIPTAYLLVESGEMTSVEFFSQSPPLPRNKIDIAVAHALAGRYMGMHCIFLEAGSGAKNPVPVEMVNEVSQNTHLFIIVGGGIRNPEDAGKRANFADAVVIGNLFEHKQNWERLRTFANAIHNPQEYNTE